jgi:hypothetical protein
VSRWLGYIWLMVMRWWVEVRTASLVRALVGDE